MGFAVSSRLPLVERYRPVMQRLARISGDNVFLIARNGDFGVCLHREEGTFPVKINTTVVGGTRPLGIGASGLAILSTFEDDEVSRIWNCHQSAFENVGLSLAKLLKAVRLTRKSGYAETIDIITNGISAVGVVIPGADDTFAAISIGGISQRLTARRRAELGALLKDSLQTVKVA
ncbi:HTH-type transcriptional regulator KipR [compost metagenome]